MSSHKFFYVPFAVTKSFVLVFSYEAMIIIQPTTKRAHSRKNLWNAVRDFITFFSFVRLCMKFNTFFAFIKLSFLKAIFV